MITVEWTVRAMGRDVGDTETVERTAFLDALIKQNRVKVIVDHDAAEELFEALADEAQSFPTEIPEVFVASIDAVSEEEAAEILAEAAESPSVKRPRR